MKTLSFQIEENHHEMLRTIKKRSGVGISFTLRKAIEMYYREFTKKNLLNAPDFSQVKNGVDK